MNRTVGKHARCGADRLTPTSFSNMLSVVTLVSIIVVTLFRAACMSIDTDSFWQIATGREIMAQGFFHTNVFTDESLDYGFVAHQWLWCVVSWLVYDMFGWPGMHVLCVVCVAVIATLLNVLSRITLGEERRYVSLRRCMVAAGLLAIQVNLTTRPHLMTVAAMLASLCVLEAWRRGRSNAILLILIPVTVFHANVHGALAPLQLALVVVYLLPGPWATVDATDNPKRRRLPLIATGIAETALMGLTPYGYAPTLSGVTAMGELPGNLDLGVVELRPVFMIDIDWIIAVYICMLVICAAPMYVKIITRRRDEKVHRHDVVNVSLASAAIAWAFMRIRMIKLFAGGAPLAVASLKTDFDARRDMRLLRPIAVSLLSFAVLAGTAFIGAQSVIAVSVNDLGRGELTARGDSPYVHAVDAIDNDRSRNAAETMVLTTFNSGGYAEFRGYRVSVDGRQELYYGEITDNDNPLIAEMLTSTADEETATDAASWLVKRVNWDYAFIDNLDGTYDTLTDAVDATDAERIYEDGQVTVWRAADRDDSRAVSD